MSHSQRVSVRRVVKGSDAQLLYDPMRREILRELSKRPLTQTQLSKILGLRPPSISHHLSMLKARGFVHLAGEKEGEHGILERFYESTAQLHFIDGGKMPLEIRRYYMPFVVERARGIFACAAARKDGFQCSSDLMEQFAVSLANNVSLIASKYEVPVVDTDPEMVICNLYGQALSATLKNGYSDLGDILLG